MIIIDQLLLFHFMVQQPCDVEIIIISISQCQSRLDPSTLTPASVHYTYCLYNRFHPSCIIIRCFQGIREDINFLILPSK